jgi:hypothetical protein
MIQSQVIHLYLEYFYNKKCVISISDALLLIYTAYIDQGGNYSIKFLSSIFRRFRQTICRFEFLHSENLQSNFIGDRYNSEQSINMTKKRSQRFSEVRNNLLCSQSIFCSSEVRSPLRLIVADLEKGDGALPLPF